MIAHSAESDPPYAGNSWRGGEPVTLSCSTRFEFPSLTARGTYRPREDRFIRLARTKFRLDDFVVPSWGYFTS